VLAVGGFKGKARESKRVERNWGEENITSGPTSVRRLLQAIEASREREKGWDRGRPGKALGAEIGEKIPIGMI